VDRPTQKGQEMREPDTTRGGPHSGNGRAGMERPATLSVVQVGAATAPFFFYADSIGLSWPLP